MDDQGVPGSGTDDETAAKHLVTRTPIAEDGETVGAVLSRLTGGSFDFAGTVSVLSDSGGFVGLVPIAEVLRARPETPVAQLIDDNSTAVTVDVDQEVVALTAIQRGMAAVPVVNAAGIFQGVVPPQALAEILRHEHVEDIYRKAGIVRADDPSEAMSAPPVYEFRRRLPWLLVGLVGSMFATAVVAGFEEAMQSKVAIAFFVPALVYLAGAVGTQSEAIAVRGLSHTHRPILRLLMDEFSTGLLIGLALAALSFPLVAFGFGDVSLALAVGIALVAAGGTATATGLLLPWVFWKMGMDPALGGGPMCTIVQDVLSLVVYFWVVTWLVL